MPILDPYSKFMTITNTILDYVKIGLLFMLFSIPVFTAGAAAAAGMTVAMKIERGEAPAVWRPFKKAFFENFKQSTVFTIIMLIVYSLFAFDWYQVMQMETTMTIKIARALLVILTVLFTIIALYIFSCIARYQLSNRAVFHNAVVYTFVNFPKNLVAVAILVTAILTYNYVQAVVPLVICFAPALEFYYMAKVCVGTFRKMEVQTADAGSKKIKGKDKSDF